VFLPETEFEKNVMTKKELVELLQVRNPKLVSGDSQSLIEGIVENVFKRQMFSKKSFNVGSQTELGEGNSDLQQKLFLIERNFESTKQQDTSNIELRLLRFKKDLQRRLEDDKEADFRRFKEF